MQYVIPENEFSELTVKRGELGGFVVKVASKSDVKEAGFASISNVIQYLNVVLGVSPVTIPAATNVAVEKPKVPAGVVADAVPTERRKPGPKPGSKRTPKTEQPAS